MAARDNVKKKIEAIAREHGYIELKEQKHVMIDFIEGRYVFSCLPTGFGKSVCFMLLPDICDSLNPGRKSMALVISPLLSLMNDQVASCSSLKIKAVAVTHESASLTVSDIIKNDCQLIYMSPEMALGTKKWRSC